jgi:hypothetical protein
MAVRDTAEQIFPELAQHQRKFLLAGAAGAVLSAIGFITNAEQFYSSYLVGYMLILGLSLGALGWAMMHQLSGGAWGVVSRQSLLAASRVIPYVTVLFLPILIGMPHLFEWTHQDVVAADSILQWKQPYLNAPFFIIRAVVGFAVFNVLAFHHNRWAKEQDETGNPGLALRMQRLSAGGLLLYVLLMTLLSFDWLMSRDPHWFSTIYGAIIIIGQGLTALAFQIIMLSYLARREPMHGALSRVYLGDLAGLMFAFVILWAYMSFSQYLIIWAGNLPEEIGWYLHRTQSGWQVLGISLVVFHFALPFILLLMRGIKQNRTLIARVAAAIIFARVLDYWWLIAPETHTQGIVISWMDVVIPLTLLAVWIGLYMQQLRLRPVLAVHDPQFEDALGPALAHGEAPRTAH